MDWWVPLQFSSITALLDNFYAFVSAWVMIAGALGMASKSMALGALAAYLMFAHFAIETGDTLLVNILTVTMVLVLVGFAFKLIRAEMLGGGEPS